jgi:hypothetical protein
MSWSLLIVFALLAVVRPSLSQSLLSFKVNRQQGDLSAIQLTLKQEREALLRDAALMNQERQEAERHRLNQEAELMRITESLTLEATAMKEQWDATNILSQLDEIEEDNRRLQAELAKQGTELQAIETAEPMYNIVSDPREFSSPRPNSSASNSASPVKPSRAVTLDVDSSASSSDQQGELVQTAVASATVTTITPTVQTPQRVTLRSSSGDLTPSRASNLKYSEGPSPTELVRTARESLRMVTPPQRVNASLHSQTDDEKGLETWLTAQEPRVQEIMKGKSTADQIVMMEQLRKQQARRKANQGDSHPERLSVRDKRDRFSFKIKKGDGIE